MDARTEELTAAHDVLSEFYAERLAGALDRMPEERAVLGLFCELVLGAEVGDIGCGTGRLDPFLAARGLAPRGIDLSPEMIRVARREKPRSSTRSLICASCRSRTPRWRESSAGIR